MGYRIRESGGGLMREILFRGKRIDNGEWAIGDLYRQTDYFGEKQSIIFEDKGNDCFKKNFVDPETVCQYTGLTDKEGNKIFEGDIVKSPFLCGVAKKNMTGIVEYKKGIFNFKHIEEKYGRQLLGYVDDIEVIGNIFDNPELLEVD